MEQEYPFRPRGKHGFDRDDVINYISQAQLRCNEHLARMEELEAAKNAWYTQAKSMEREKAALVARVRELEEQLERGVAAPAGETSGGDWFPQNDPLLSPFTATEAAELAALKTRCLELDEQLSEQNGRIAQLEQQLEEQRACGAELERQLEAEKALMAEMELVVQAEHANAQALQEEKDTLLAEKETLQTDRDALLTEKTVLLEDKAELLEEKAALEQAIEERDAQQAEALPRFTLHQQENEALRAQLDQQVSQVQQYATRIAALEQEQAAVQGQLKDSETERAAYAEQIPALQAQLARLAESAEQISTLEAVKAALATELESAKAQAAAAAREIYARDETIVQLKRDKSDFNQRLVELTQAEAQASQKQATLAEEAAALRTRIAELEKISPAGNEDALRSMVLSSFNYSNLYVDNNLKTAQFISEATSRNIGHVSDSANSLLEQVEAISRSFSDTTDNIRRSLAAFQHELSGIQNGMNRRLSKDRFKALLEENERLRARLETELLAELSSEDDELPAPMPPMPNGNGAQLPFAEDLPPSYHAYLDD